MSIRIKRIYDSPDRSDGYRVLVDRLWPRGMRKADVAIEEWLKDLAPSTELRKWYNHDLEKWPEFKRRYFKELANRRDALADLRRRAQRGRVTLLFSARETRYNNAEALKEYLERGASH